MISGDGGDEGEVGVGGVEVLVDEDHGGLYLSTRPHHLFSANVFPNCNPKFNNSVSEKISIFVKNQIKNQKKP